MAEAKKETAAQRVERIKRERAPWSIMDDIRRYAREGFDAIPNEDLTVRFRAWGLYTQGDGGGTRGQEMPYFMMRLRTPNGLLTSAMVKTVADLADRYARGTIDITNRQNFQLHWLRIEDIPDLWDALAEVGWTSQGSCGDNTRTVTGCPLAGVDHEELIDASPIAAAVDRFLNGNDDYANLPRKFKITITGCRHWCTYPEINDVAFTAAVLSTGEIGFHVRVGGGLSTRPHLAVPLPIEVRAEEVPDVAAAIAGVFRDSDELRKNRAKARMKFLFIAQGWTAETFVDAIEAKLGRALTRAVPDAPPSGEFRDHVGVHPQKQRGLSYAGFSVPSGRISPDQLRQIAALADAYGDGALRLTAAQNIVVLNVPNGRVPALVASAARIGVPIAGSPFQRGTLSCTGSEFCKLALTETKHFSIDLAKQLEARLPGFQETIKVHVAGCPNSCGQQWIADVGLQGVHLQGGEGDEVVEGFDFFVGGGLGARATLAHRVGYRAPATEVPDALERLFTAYRADQRKGESFGAWSVRVGDAVVKRALDPATVDAA